LESRNLLSFGPPNNFPVDAAPLGMALADLNGDGKLDAVASSYANGTVSVLLGNGDGTFQPAQSFFAGARASSVAIGDFNGDNIPDLAVGHFTGSATTVSVLLGNGDGTFQGPMDYTVGKQPIRVITADLNGDGILDLVAANNNSASISVLLGNGDGTFQPNQDYAVGRSPIGVTAADLNGDHIPDLMVANSGSNTVSILFGNGDGTFQSPVDYSVGSGSADVAVGDFNGDGAPDLAVTSLVSHDVTILLNDGQGGFQVGDQYQVGATPIGAVVSDFNSDGKLDLVIAYYTATAPVFTATSVTTLLGNGDGTFQDPVDYATDVGPVGVAVGDLNGDGSPDIVATDAMSSEISVLLNLNDWMAPPPAAMPPGSGQGPRAEQEPVLMPANSGADFGRHNEAFFLLFHANENAMKDEGPVLPFRTGARGSEGLRLDGNLDVGSQSSNNFQLYDGLAATIT